MKKSTTTILIAIVGLVFSVFVVADHIKAQPVEKELDGWIWSSNIGWISLNCKNSNSGSDCSDVDYHVSVGSDGSLTGYAWSGNIGWIKFGGLSNLPSGGSQAKINEGNGNLSGFARALAAIEAGYGTALDNSGGWDGFVSLAGANYGLKAGGTPYSSYAWGDDVVGWAAGNVGVISPDPIGVAGCSIPMEVVIVIDKSNSMQGAPIAAAKAGAKAFVDSMNPAEVGVGVVSFDENAALNHAISSNFQAVKSAIDSISDNYGTNIGSGIDLAHNQLDNDNVKKVIVLLSDGFARSPESYSGGPNQYAIDQALEAKEDGVEVYAIGLENRDDSLFAGLLEDISDQGRFYIVDDSSQLGSAFSTVASEVCGGFFNYEIGANNAEVSRGGSVDVPVTITLDVGSSDSEDVELDTLPLDLPEANDVDISFVDGTLCVDFPCEKTLRIEVPSDFDLNSFDLTISGVSTITNHGRTKEITITVTDAPPTTVTLTADDYSIKPGEGTVLRWDSTGADSCEADWTSSNDPDGSETVSPSSDETYEIVCTGPGGTGRDEVTIDVDPNNNGGTPPTIEVSCSVDGGLEHFVNEEVTFTATASGVPADAPYNWTMTDIHVPSSIPTTSTVKVRFLTVGVKQVEVEVGGKTAECKVGSEDIRITVDPNFEEE